MNGIGITAIQTALKATYEVQTPSTLSMIDLIPVLNQPNKNELLLPIMLSASTEGRKELRHFLNSEKQYQR